MLKDSDTGHSQLSVARSGERTKRPFHAPILKSAVGQKGDLGSPVSCCPAACGRRKHIQVLTYLSWCLLPRTKIVENPMIGFWQNGGCNV